MEEDIIGMFGSLSTNEVIAQAEDHWLTEEISIMC